MKMLALIVEDDPDLQREMSAELERMEFEVRCALHYDAALQQLEASPVPGIVCVDLELPTESGYDLCEYIRGPLGLARVPILVTSDSGFPEDLVCAEAAGATAFLQKPFSMQDFSSSVVAVLEGAPLSGTQTRSMEP